MRPISKFGRNHKGPKEGEAKQLTFLGQIPDRRVSRK